MQAERCYKLATSLYHYHQQEGDYPKALLDLVEAGILSAEEFQDLQFQASRSAAPQEWDYYQPSESTDLAILSKEPIFPWKGHSGEYVASYGGGATETFGARKLSSLLKKIKARGL